MEYCRFDLAFGYIDEIYSRKCGKDIFNKNTHIV